MPHTVLITGCSSGIGRQLAIRLHQKQHRVYATARNVKKLEALQAQGIRCLSLDVTDNESIKQALASIEQNGDKVDWLINNAGYGAMGPLAEMPHAEIERQFSTNLYGPLALTRALVPTMKQQGGGRIVNLGSVSGILVTPFSGAYCATKAALHAVSDALRMELAPFNIDVIVIQPGAIESEFGSNAEASLQRTLSNNSLYETFKDGILRRARASQDNPTPTPDFVESVIQLLEKSNPPPVARLGNGSTALPILARWIPTRLLDSALKRKFGLS